MTRRKRGKPTWQNRYNKKPEDTPDELFDRWCNLKEKIQDGMQKAIDRIYPRVSKKGKKI